MFWTNFVKLCAEDGISPNKLAAQCGVKSTGTVSAWKKGTMPSNKTLSKIADHFKVSVETLINEDALETLQKLRQEGKYPFGPISKENKPALPQENELTEKQRKAWNIVKSMSDAQLDAFIAAGEVFLR